MGRKHQFQFAEEALLEIQDSYDWCEERVLNLGERFLYDLNECLDQVDQNPLINRIVYRQFRQGRLSRFPFVIVYEVQDNRIRVLSVFHTSRDPKSKFRDG